MLQYGFTGQNVQEINEISMKSIEIALNRYSISSSSPIKYIKKKFPHFQPGRGIRKTFIPKNRFFSTKNTIKMNYMIRVKENPIFSHQKLDHCRIE